MDWKKGTITFDNGTKCAAEFLVKPDGQIWNARIKKDGKTVEEIDVSKFANKLNMKVDDIYPYTFEIDE